jgi:hypothetical protein
MLNNEPTTLFFKEGNELKVDIGGNIKASVVMDGPTSAVTYVTTELGSPIISIPMISHKNDLVKILEKNFPDGKVAILYDGKIDTSGHAYKAYISRIVITKPLKLI